MENRIITVFKRRPILIEYEDTQNNANHIHRALRDFDRDFGGDLLAQHMRRRTVKRLRCGETSDGGAGNAPKAVVLVTGLHRPLTKGGGV
jgi:hypothetical protein